MENEQAQQMGQQNNQNTGSNQTDIQKELNNFNQSSSEAIYDALVAATEAGDMIDSLNASNYSSFDNCTL